MVSEKQNIFNEIHTFSTIYQQLSLAPAVPSFAVSGRAGTVYGHGTIVLIVRYLPS